jgi:hypothetical protein
VQIVVFLEEGRKQRGNYERMKLMLLLLVGDEKKYRYSRVFSDRFVTGYCRLYLDTVCLCILVFFVFSVCLQIFLEWGMYSHHVQLLFIPSIFSHSKWINNSTMAYIPSIFFYISIQVRIYINFIQTDSMPVLYLNSSILIR